MLNFRVNKFCSEGHGDRSETKILGYKKLVFVFLGAVPVTNHEILARPDFNIDIQLLGIAVYVVLHTSIFIRVDMHIAMFD